MGESALFPGHIFSKLGSLAASCLFSSSQHYPPLLPSSCSKSPRRVIRPLFVLLSVKVGGVNWLDGWGWLALLHIFSSYWRLSSLLCATTLLFSTYFSKDDRCGPRMNCITSSGQVLVVISHHWIRNLGCGCDAACVICLPGGSADPSHLRATVVDKMQVWAEKAAPVQSSCPLVSMRYFQNPNE